MIQAAIPRDGVFLRASAIGVPLGLLYQQPPAAALLFDQVAAELEARLELNHHQRHGDDHTRLMD